MAAKKALSKRQQIADQSSKGVVLGLVTTAVAGTALDAVTQGAIIVLASTVLAWLCTLVGDKTFASFLNPK